MKGPPRVAEGNDGTAIPEWFHPIQRPTRRTGPLVTTRPFKCNGYGCHAGDVMRETKPERTGLVVTHRRQSKSGRETEHLGPP